MQFSIRTFWAVVLFFTMSMHGLASINLIPGEQYIKIDRLVKNAPSVVEFFSFYCPPCSSFYSPYKVVKSIELTLPKGVKVEKYHTSYMGTMGKQLTEAWSIAKVLGVEDKVEGLIFDAIQNKRSIKSVADIKSIFIKAGVDASDYDSAKNSFIVKTLSIQQEKAAEEFGVTGTPSFYVRGKYLIINSGIKNKSVEGFGKEFAEVVNQLMNANP